MDQIIDDIIKEIEAPLTEVVLRTLRQDIAYNMAVGNNYEEQIDMYREIAIGGDNDEYTGQIQPTSP